MLAMMSWLLVAGAAKAPDCDARAWEPLGLAAPCADTDRTNPEPEAFERTWQLPLGAARAAAHAWALGSSALAAPAWLQVVRAAPHRVEPIAAMSIRAWPGPPVLLAEALAVSAAPLDNARRILAGFRDRQLIGDATPAIYHWLFQQGPPGLAAIVDAGLEPTRFGVVAGLAGLARLDASVSKDAGLARLRARWARATLTAAVTRNLDHLAAQLYRSLDGATRDHVLHDGTGDDPRRALAVALLLDGAPELARALARARGSSPTTGRRADRFPVPCSDFSSVVLRDDGGSWSPDEQFQARVSVRRCHSSPAALALLRPRLSAAGQALADRYREHADRLQEGRAEERPEARTADFENEWRRVHDEVALESARYRRLADESAGSQHEPLGAVHFPLSVVPSATTPFQEVRARTSSKRQEPALFCPELPDDFEQVTARKQADGHCLVVAVSQALDPNGEATRGGYWLFREGGGGQWERGGIYLGLRQYRPYSITPFGDVSLEHGVLTVAARRREIDESSIRFPPLSTKFRVEGGPLSLKVDLAVLTRDTDADGIPDLEEERMLLDPLRADSDGDGIRDGDDAFPNVADRGPAAPEAGLMTAVLAAEDEPVAALMTAPGTAGAFPAVRQQRRPKVTFVVGNPRQFVGVRATSQVVVLTRSQAMAALARFGTFYPTTLDVVMHPGGNQAVVWRDSQWTGGTYLCTKSEGAWSVKSVQSWVS